MSFFIFSLANNPNIRGEYLPVQRSIFGPQIYFWWPRIYFWWPQIFEQKTCSCVYFWSVNMTFLNKHWFWLFPCGATKSVMLSGVVHHGGIFFYMFADLLCRLALAVLPRLHVCKLLQSQSANFQKYKKCADLNVQICYNYKSANFLKLVCKLFSKVCRLTC